MAVKQNALSQRFEYTGSVQEFTAPQSGLYQLEVWGASGGDGKIISGTQHGSIGGLGGYSCGYVYLNADSTLYICVGGKGNEHFGDLPYDPDADEGEEYEDVKIPGGYNGGGWSMSWHNNTNNWQSCCGSGGGATHIAVTNRGILENYSNFRSEILLIAGGGGGACAATGHPWEAVYNGGHGGGLTGGLPQPVTLDNVEEYSQPAATQSSGFQFGLGQGAYEGGGGGGWYGGAYIAGGSGYIGGVPELVYQSRTYTPSTVNGINNGNGAALITLTQNPAPAVYLGNKQISAVYFGVHDITDIKTIH